MPISEPVFAKQ